MKTRRETNAEIAARLGSDEAHREGWESELADRHAQAEAHAAGIHQEMADAYNRLPKVRG